MLYPPLENLLYTPLSYNFRALHFCYQLKLYILTISSKRHRLIMDFSLVINFVKTNTNNERILELHQLHFESFVLKT